MVWTWLGEDWLVVGVAGMNWFTPGICSGHRSGEDLSSFSKALKLSSKSSRSDSASTWSELFKIGWLLLDWLWSAPFSAPRSDNKSPTRDIMNHWSFSEKSCIEKFSIDESKSMKWNSIKYPHHICKTCLKCMFLFVLQFIFIQICRLQLGSV